MKKTAVKSVCARLSALLMLLPLVCACSPRVTLHLTFDASRDALVSGEDHVYYFAPVAYEPASVTKTPYAEWDGSLLYPVTGWDPELLLTEEFTGVGGLLCSADLTLPSLTGMDPASIYVCTASDRPQAILEITDKDTVSEAAALLETGKQIDLPSGGTLTLYLKFCSPEYEGIFYNVLFIQVGETEDALRCLYDRSTKRCVEVPYGLFEGLLYGEE